MTDPLLLDLFEAYLENRLGRAERGELQATLLRAPTARRQFLEYMQQHAMIGELLAEAQGHRLALEGERAAPALLASSLTRAIGLVSRQRLRWAVLAAAVILVVGLLVQRYLPSNPSDSLVRLEEVHGEVFIATDTSEVPAEKGRIVRSGERLKTSAGGMAVLRYDDNTRVELNTDTMVRLLAGGQGVGKQILLQHGELLAEVAPQPEGQPLLLTTPEAEARVLGTRFRSLSLAGSTRIELEEGRMLVTRRHDRQSVAVPSGMFVVASADDKALEPLPLPAQVTKPRTLLVSRGEPLIAAAYAADGRLVTATADGWLESYPATNRPPPLRFQDPAARRQRAVAVSVDGQWLAAGGTDGRVTVRDVATGLLRANLSYAIDIDPKAIGPDGKLLFGGKHMQFRSTPGGLAFAPDGRSLAVVDRAKAGYAIQLYDTQTWKPRFALGPQPQPVVAVAFSPKGDALAAAGQEGVTVWDLAGRRQRYRLEGSDSLRALAYSPDGRWLAGGGDDGRLMLWNALTGRLAASFPGLFRRCYALAYSPDSRMLATAHEGYATLWDVAGHREIAAFKGHSVAIFSLSFSPDGRTLATAGWERYTRLWDITDDIRGKVLVAMKRLMTIPGPPAAPYQASMLDLQQYSQLRTWKCVARSNLVSSHPAPLPIVSCHLHTDTPLVCGAWSRLDAGFFS